MCAVAIGSSAEHGSSIRITSGLTAIARAMHSRCCWPPDRLMPGVSSRSLTSLEQARAAQACLDDLVQLGLARSEAVDARAVGNVVDRSTSETDWASGTPCRSWRAAARRRRRDRRCRRRRAGCRPAMRQPSMISFMRFRQRRKVDLPQPLGPISAVTCRSRECRDRPRTAPASRHTRG